jgi:hypothetical protein
MAVVIPRVKAEVKMADITGPRSMEQHMYRNDREVRILTTVVMAKVLPKTPVIAGTMKWTTKMMAMAGAA